MTSHEKTLLTSLESELKAVKKAREALGDRAPAVGRDRTGDRDSGRGGRGDFGSRGGRGGRDGVLGKRRRDSESEGDSDVPEDVQRIPMPRDTPPPFPKEVLDKWHQARRDRWARDHPESAASNNTQSSSGGTNANSTPLANNGRSAGFNARREERGNNEAEKERPKVEAKTVYESAPVVRDLRKEAVAFVPAVVRKKLEKGRGAGGLLEPEEADRLEREGYLGGGKSKSESLGAGAAKQEAEPTKNVQMEEVDDEDG